MQADSLPSEPPGKPGLEVWEWMHTHGGDALQECAAWAGATVKQQCEGWGGLVGDETVSPGPQKAWKLCQETWACSEADQEPENQHGAESRRQMCFREAVGMGREKS